MITTDFGEGDYVVPYYIYENLLNLLNNLIDEVGENENHTLANFMETVGVMIKKYEDRYYPVFLKDGVVIHNIYELSDNEQVSSLLKNDEYTQWEIGFNAPYSFV